MIEELGLRGRVNVFMGRGIFIVLCEVLAFQDLFFSFLRMFRIALEALLQIFPYMPRIMGKTLWA